MTDIAAGMIGGQEPGARSPEEDGSAELLARLEDWFRPQRSVLVAYSGGVDSALVMAAAHRVLSRTGGRALACIGTSPSYPARELAAALELAHSLGAAVRIVPTEEHLDPRYAANPANRCYFCKSELYTRLGAIARTENYALIVDGNNATDLAGGDEERPGSRAAREKGVRSPLAEVGMTKEEVRRLARYLELPVWNKPAMPCTSSRVPHGMPIVPGLLKQIEAAESALLAMGFRELRVRHHGDVARIELRPEDFSRAVEMGGKITAAVRACGYKFVALDLAGLQSGGLHRATKDVP
jgi:uncharacterized protein